MPSRFYFTLLFNRTNAPNYCCFSLGRLSRLGVWLLTVGVLSACGGSGGSSRPASISSVAGDQSSIQSVSSLTSNSLASAPMATVTLAGVVTYDFIPHFTDSPGLNYAGTTAMPVRGAVVELLNANGAIIATSSTNAQGGYSFTVAKNTLVKVRVKAELLQKTSPTWDFKVTDNTANNALYSLDGQLASSGDSNSQRNYHASSGWDGNQYSSTRAAAPFAILDDIYTAATHLSAAGNHSDLKPLELRWSTKNNAADGDKTLGEVGTSFYNGDAIYILGDAANDFDEYDSHVIVHEWGHYIEQNLSRADSFGGEHADGDVLDMRVSMSEGFADAFASIMLDDPYYADAASPALGSGFVIDISRRDHSAQGFYSEGSISSIFYNYYISSNGKPANDFSSMFSVLTDSTYYSNDALTSIFLFYARFKALFPNQALQFNSLMQEQNIFGTDEYGSGETNDAGYAPSLPVYKMIQANGSAVNVCSSFRFGKFNKLANSQLLKLNVAQAGSYSITVVRSGGAAVATQPEGLLFKRGESILGINGTTNNSASANASLAQGIYILEIYDANNRDENNLQRNTTCFNVQLTAN